MHNFVLYRVKWLNYFLTQVSYLHKCKLYKYMCLAFYRYVALITYAVVNTNMSHCF